MNRRNFLKLAGLAIATPKLPASDSWPETVYMIDWYGKSPALKALDDIKDFDRRASIWIANFNHDGHITELWPKEES